MQMPNASGATALHCYAMTLNNKQFSAFEANVIDFCQYNKRANNVHRSVYYIAHIENLDSIGQSSFIRFRIKIFRQFDGFLSEVYHRTEILLGVNFMSIIWMI